MRIKKVLRFGLGLVLIFMILVLGVGILAYAFKDKIHVMALREVESQMNAQVQIEDSGMLLFEHWPNIAIELKGVSLSPYLEREISENPILKARKIVVVIDFFSLFGENYELKALSFSKPEVFLEKDKVGRWNYGELFKSKDSKTSSNSNFVLNLKKLLLSNGKLIIRDGSKKEEFVVLAVNGELLGVLSSEKLNLDSEIDFLIQNMPGIESKRYNDMRVASQFILTTDLKGNTEIRLENSELAISDLKVLLNGMVGFSSKGILMNVDFRNQESDFEDLIKVFPSFRKVLGEGLSYHGKFGIDGSLKGLATNTASPKLAFKYHIIEGGIVSKENEARLENIKMKGEFVGWGVSDDSSRFSISNFKANLGKEEIHGKFLYSNLTNPSLDAEVIGRLNLKQLDILFPGIFQEMGLTGYVLSTAHIKGKVADLKEKKYKNIEAGGKLKMESVSFKLPEMHHAIKNLEGEFSMEKGGFKIQQLSGKVGSSDFKVEGTMDNLIPYLIDSTEKFTGNLKLTSTKWTMEDFLMAETEDNQGEISYKMDPRISMTLDFKVGTFKMGNLLAKKVRGKAKLLDQKLILKKTTINLFDGSAILAGKMELDKKGAAPMELQLSWKNLNINTTFSKLSQWGDFTLVEDHMYGTFSGKIDMQCNLLSDFSVDPKSLKAAGSVEIVDGKLEKYEPLYELAGFVKLDKLKQVVFSDIQTDFLIENQELVIPSLDLEAHDYHMYIKGKHGFDQSLDYHIIIELPKLLAGKSKNSKVKDLIEEEEGEDIRVRIPLFITGNVDNPEFKWDRKVAKKTFTKELKKEKEELKESFNKDVEELFGKQDTNEVDDYIEVEEDEDEKKLFKNLNLPFGKKKKKKD